MTKRITLKEFQRRFHKVRDRGFVKSLRRGPTGIGYTLVAELGLTKNTFQLADLGRVTIIPAQVNSQEMIPLVRLKAIGLRSFVDSVRRNIDAQPHGVLPYINSVVEQAPNSNGLFLQFTEQQFELRSIWGSVVHAWSFDEIAFAAKRNAGHILYISAVVEKRISYDAFYFLRAQLLSRMSKSGFALGNKTGDTSLILNRRISKNSVSRTLAPHLYLRKSECWRFFESVQDL